VVLHRIAGLKTALASIKLLETTQIATKIIPQCSMLVLDKSTEVRNLALTLMDGSIARLRDYHESMIEAEREAKEEALAKKFPSTPSQSNMNTSGILSTPVAESIMNVGGWTSWLTSKQSESTLPGNSNANIDNSMNTSNTLEPGSPGPSMANLNLGNSTDELDNTSKSTTSIKSLSLSSKSTSKAAVNNKGWDEDDFGFGNDDNDNHKPKPQNKSNNNTSNKGFDDFDDGLNFDDDDDEDNQQQQKNNAKKFSSSSLSAKANQEGSEKSKSTKEKAKPAAKIAVKKLDFKKDDEAWEDF
jgi:hypothetical protein